MDYRTAAQTALFRAARELRAVAQAVLDDMQNDVELTSELSTVWAKDKARDYAEQANELERAGYEFGNTPGSNAERALRKSHAAYSQAIDRYEARKASAEARKTPA